MNRADTADSTILADYGRNTVGKIVKRYFGSPFSLVSNLIEDEQIDAEQLRQLLGMVENKKTPGL